MTAVATAFTPVVAESVEAGSAAWSPECKSATNRPHVIELNVGGVNVWIWREAPVGIVPRSVV